MTPAVGKPRHGKRPRSGSLGIMLVAIASRGRSRCGAGALRGIGIQTSRQAPSQVRATERATVEACGWRQTVATRNRL